jgi:hypothetical protein
VRCDGPWGALVSVAHVHALGGVRLVSSIALGVVGGVRGAGSACAVSVGAYGVNGDDDGSARMVVVAARGIGGIKLLPLFKLLHTSQEYNPNLIS